MDLNFSKSYDNAVVAVVVALFVLLYGLHLARHPLPPVLHNLFNNLLFRVVFLALVVYYGLRKSPTVSITVALLFVLTLHYLNEKEMFDDLNYIN